MRLKTAAWIGLAFVATGLLLRYELSVRHAPDPKPPVQSSDEEMAVLKIIDGDTILVDLNGSGSPDGKVEEVRLLGVDADELGASKTSDLEHARKAKEFVRSMVAHRPVRLERGWKKIDRYGRTLAFVYVDLDGRTVCLNEEIVRQGYARFYRQYQRELPPAMRKRLRAAETEARNSARGPLWHNVSTP